MACGTNIVPGFQETNRKVNFPMDEKAFNKYMDESVSEPVANTPEDIIEAQRTVRHIQEEGKHPDDAIQWRKPREISAPQRKKEMAQPDSLVFAASQVKEGKMSVQKFRELVQKSDSPVTPMQEVPELVSVTNLARALDAGKAGKGRIIGLPGIEIQEGTNVGLRLDIPAYQNMDTWVNAIHFKDKVEGVRPGNAYSTASAGTDAVFGQHSKKAVKVATGTAKSPFAVIDVAWQNQTPEQTHREITAALEDSKQPNSRWKQIGMNPNRSGFFYDKATFLPVASASRVLQVGALVMAQDVQYVGREGDTMFAPKMGEFFGNKAEKEFDNQLDNELNMDEAIMKFDSVGYKSPLNPNVEVVLDRDKNPVPMHNKHPMKNKYSFMINKGANKKANAVFKNIGSPYIVMWSFDRGHYNSQSRAINLRIKADTLKNGNVIYNDLIGTAVHETWHWVDYILGENVYPEESEQGQFNVPIAFSGNDKGFKTAFFKDGQNLGITLDEGKWSDGAVRNRYQQDVYSRSTRIWNEHDDNLAALVFYEQMLNDPLIYKTIQKLVFSVEPIKRNKMFRYIFRGDEINRIPQLVNPITDEDVYSTYGHSFLLYDESVTNAQHLIVPDQLVKMAETYGSLPTLSEIPKEIERIDKELKDSKEMAEMDVKRQALYREMHEEGKSLGQQLKLLMPAMDIVDAMTSGDAHDNGQLSGHGTDYYTNSKSGLTDGGFYYRMAEAFAQLGSAWSSKDERAWQYMEKYFPNLTTEFESIIKKHAKRKVKSAIYTTGLD